MQNSNKPEFNVCAIILSAGLSSRMGKFKPLLEIDDIPAIRRLIHSVSDALIDDIVVVTGHNNVELEKLLAQEKVIIAYNPDYKEGMFTSIQTGLKKASSIGDYDAFLLFLVDVPLVPSSLIVSLLSTMKEQDEFMVPCYEGKKGHPLIIPKKYLSEILGHDGTNGLKGVTAKYDDKMIRIDTDEESVVLDMDNPDDYEEILAYFDKSKSPKLKQNIIDETGFEGKLYLVRHGSTELHKEKIFMGQVDIPLSNEGRHQVEKAADALIEYKPRTDIIYSSPLLRAEESSQIIKKRFEKVGMKKEILLDSAFMEMSLGDWDGRYIGDIKKEFPREYEKRGENILTYKRSPNGENHYDLKYRVLKELKNIMKNTQIDKDIILVSHKGVINVIRESILELDSLDARKYNPPKGSVTIIDVKTLLKTH